MSLTSEMTALKTGHIHCPQLQLDGKNTIMQYMTTVCLMAKVANGILACINSVDSRTRTVIGPSTQHW